MDFKEYLKESLESSAIQMIQPKELIDLMNRFKAEEQELADRERRASPLVFADMEERTFPKIDRIIEELSRIKDLKGNPLLTRFIQVLGANGFGQDSKPIIALTNKYVPRILDVYVSSDDEAPAFLKKGTKF